MSNSKFSINRDFDDLSVWSLTTSQSTVSYSGYSIVQPNYIAPGINSPQINGSALQIYAYDTNSNWSTGWMDITQEFNVYEKGVYSIYVDHFVYGTSYTTDDQYQYVNGFDGNWRNNYGFHHYLLLNGVVGASRAVIGVSNQLRGWTFSGGGHFDIGTHSLTLRVSANWRYGYGLYSYFDNLRIDSGGNDGNASFSITGTVAVGNTLSINQDTSDPDGTGNLSYSWQTSSDNSNWTVVGTNATYTVGTSEDGKSIRAVLSYTDAEGFNETVNTSTSSIPSVDSGDASFSISETVAVGNTLGINQDTSDPDGTGTLSYSWQTSSIIQIGQ